MGGMVTYALGVGDRAHANGLGARTFRRQSLAADDEGDPHKVEDNRPENCGAQRAVSARRRIARHGATKMAQTAEKGHSTDPFWTLSFWPLGTPPAHSVRAKAEKTLF